MSSNRNLVSSGDLRDAHVVLGMDGFPDVVIETGEEPSPPMRPVNANLATNEVKTNGEFVLPGFGKLVRSERKAREGRNPATGETIQIPAKTTLKFRVGKAMKDSVLPRK